MSSLREEIRSALDVSPTIDPAAEVSRRVGFLKDYLRASSTKGFVLGISGGQDSALAGRLCQLAAQESRLEGVAAEFIAVRLPYGVQADEEDAQVALRFIDPDRTIVINIKETSDAATKAVAEALGETPTDFVRGNIKARERMVVQYAAAGQHRLLVVGTDHAAEAVTGFFTKFGDGGVDVTPLTGLVGRHLRHGRVQIDIGQPVLRHGDPQLQARDRVVGDATDQVDIDPQRGELAGHSTERAGGHWPPQHHNGVRRRILDHRTVPAEFDVDVEPEGVHGFFELVL
ncbi:NH(3)-dependent NAD(+) synthetase [Mycobacteroides abscessus]|uniref:NH(3)-dependent NAD(+) synthetase n=1 Tax=Mycobacteroides abscessus TaxID=36809 RepID=A0AB33TF14_9MYCO|nr:NH(3)-dependent NAD(+) synthetase [Mycobacteroides abscessus]CPT76263.1 NH(3)-dependent NAD(+) synthetase [Mycobacteroides abscessus]CPV18157.1 NH(3)-dependent NAD(+) synthetase [Mycobacteroides abscessus]CPV65166.1 NH(3)-dependent NAD(+) synthetase [Mycobacteroides abscessus]CPX80356.1 NH(3)-dependent NAD(+) synthetase [Mycobacteroides abscessus]